MLENLRILPKLRDSLTFLYVECATIEQDEFSIIIEREAGRMPVPVAATTVLMLGPGTSITHAAIKTIADSGCMVVWCGEKASRFYAAGQGETRSAENLLVQAKFCMDERLHMEVVRRMYTLRFPKVDTSGMTLQQIRGLEGIRVREAYRMASKMTGVKWKKREYKSEDWDDSDDINRALSYANTILYGLCQAAVVSLGFSPGLGFIHTGKLLSFVYDIADLYKMDTTIPAAFAAVARAGNNLEKAVRMECRARFQQQRVLARIPEDIETLFAIVEGAEERENKLVGDLWDSADATAMGGRNYAGKDE